MSGRSHEVELLRHLVHALTSINLLIESCDPNDKIELEISQRAACARRDLAACAKLVPRETED